MVQSWRTRLRGECGWRAVCFVDISCGDSSDSFLEGVYVRAVMRAARAVGGTGDSPQSFAYRMADFLAFCASFSAMVGGLGGNVVV